MRFEMPLARTLGANGEVVPGLVNIVPGHAEVRVRRLPQSALIQQKFWSESG